MNTILTMMMTGALSEFQKMHKAVSINTRFRLPLMAVLASLMLSALLPAQPPSVSLPRNRYLIATLPPKTEGLMPLALTQIPSALVKTSDVGITALAKRTMTFAEIIGRATSNHPGVQQAKRQAESFRGAWIQAGLKANPSLELSSEEMNRDSDGLHGATYSQPITPKYKRDARQAAVSREYQVAQQTYQKQCRKAENDALLTAYRVAFAYRKCVILEEITQIAQDSQYTSGELLRAKETERSAFLEIKIQTERRQIDLKNAEIVYRTACKELAILLGLPEEELIYISDSVETLPAELNESALLAEILAVSPEMQQAYAEVEAAKAKLRQQCAEAGVDYEANARIAYNTETKLSEVSVGVVIPLHFFDRNQGNIKQAQSELAAAHQNVERLKRLIAQQYGQLWGKYQTARNRLVAYKENILPEALELRTLAFEAYRRGEYGSHEMLTAQSTFAELQLEYFDTLSALMESQVLLQGALLSGGLEKPER